MKPSTMFFLAGSSLLFYSALYGISLTEILMAMSFGFATITAWCDR